MTQPLADPVPSRVRVLILGGGIHGVGTLHDLASRGWRDVFLVEKKAIGCGTSSRSTKLVHGGLRYLKNPRDFSLVSEALRERQILATVAADLVHPLELTLPVMRGYGLPAPLLKLGMVLYDLLAGKARIHRHHFINASEFARRYPMLQEGKFSGGYSFWDMQTDDLALVRRVASSARNLGAGISEMTQVEKIIPDRDGWLVDLRLSNGSMVRISARYVVNALGPWANQILEDSGLSPEYRGVNNEGVHILLPNMGLQSGLLMQSPADGRIFFILPWQGLTLIGTTEDLYTGDPDKLAVREESIEYLIKRCNEFLKTKLSTGDVLAAFAGLRWLALEPGRSLTSLSRHFVIAEQSSQRGVLYTIYGGKLTTYRRLAEILGDKICRNFGDHHASQTDQTSSWVTADQDPLHDLHDRNSMDPLQRFAEGGITYTPFHSVSA